MYKLASDLKACHSEIQPYFGKIAIWYGALSLMLFAAPIGGAFFVIRIILIIYLPIPLSKYYWGKSRNLDMFQTEKYFKLHYPRLSRVDRILICVLFWASFL